MKKAEIIIIGCEHDGSFIPINEVLRLIKQAQEYAIRETVKECVEQARMKEVWEGNTGREYCDTIIDANSILSVADKLIKEL